MVWDFPIFSSVIAYRCAYKCEYCKYGTNCYHYENPEDCFYAHSDIELRSKACINYVNGRCDDRNCQYTHYNDIPTLSTGLLNRITNCINSRGNTKSIILDRKLKSQRGKSRARSLSRSRSRSRSPVRQSRRSRSPIRQSRRSRSPVNYEKKIADLERENKYLREQLELKNKLLDLR
jgi:hypothetical protein